jgi:hypothetical protein
LIELSRREIFDFCADYIVILRLGFGPVRTILFLTGKFKSHHAHDPFDIAIRIESRCRREPRLEQGSRWSDLTNQLALGLKSSVCDIITRLRCYLRHLRIAVMKIDSVSQLQAIVCRNGIVAAA